MNPDVLILDTTMRDGDHAVLHQYTAEQVNAIADGLEGAGVHYLEISHGEGMGGSSIQYGKSLHDEFVLIESMAGCLKNTKLTVLLLPGIGTKDELQIAIDHGAKAARIATHCTEADIGEQHIGMAKEFGLEAMGLLMMSHMEPASKILEQAKLFESYGADVVYAMDSAGAMLPEQVKERVDTLKQNLNCKVGFHAHNNLSMAIANTVESIKAGADIVDGTLCGLGGGAGNAQIEVLISVLHKLGYQTGVDEFKLMDAAEECVRPIMQRPQEIDKAALMLGYAGVYSTFLIHAYRAAEKFDVPVADVLMELGARRTVGGQEDLIIDVAIELAKREAEKQRRLARMQNKLKTDLRNGKTVIGTFHIEIASPAVPEICAHGGFDFIIIDTEHSPFDFETVIECIRSARAAGISSIVRVWENNQGLITRILDSSPDGIMVPSIGTPQEAEEVVNACKYAPKGMRGVAPMSRYSLHDDWFNDENERIFVSVQIEGTEAVKRASEIMAVDGVDMGFIGPYDLSQSLGIPGQFENPKLVEKVKEVVDAKPEGCSLGIYAGDIPMSKRWMDAGVQFIAIQLDSMILRNAVKEISESLRA